jgi:hypothetical protein
MWHLSRHSMLKQARADLHRRQEDIVVQLTCVAQSHLTCANRRCSYVPLFHPCCSYATGDSETDYHLNGAVACVKRFQ